MFSSYICLTEDNNFCQAKKYKKLLTSPCDCNKIVNVLRNTHATVAQLVEHNLAKVGVAGSNPVCRSQDFVLTITYATVAQLVEHNLAKVGVAGSNPVCRSQDFVQTIAYATVAQLVEHNLAKVGVAGSNPVCRSESFRIDFGSFFQFYVHMRRGP